jgi:D-glycero-D-manno-heptose 1,7-bisphosphate phosphatase
MHRAVFVDRDGVICRNRNDHVKRWEEFVFLPGALEAMARLARLDLYIVVITNQAIINRRMAPVEVVEDIHARMVRDIEAAGGRVDQVTYCPHRPDERCACRKPQPGLLLKAKVELELDLSQSYLVGDAKTDMQAARAVGCRRELVRCWLHGEQGFKVVPDLGSAVSGIVQREDGAGWRVPQLARRGGGEW